MSLPTCSGTTKETKVLGFPRDTSTGDWSGTAVVRALVLEDATRILPRFVNMLEVVAMVGLAGTILATHWIKTLFVFYHRYDPSHVYAVTQPGIPRKRDIGTGGVSLCGFMSQFVHGNPTRPPRRTKEWSWSVGCLLPSHDAPSGGP